MKTKRFSGSSIIITAVLSVLVTLGAVALIAWLVLGSSGLAVTAGAAVINTRFVGEYDEDALADAALDAMVDSLGDRWSYYMDAESYEASKLRRANVYLGIGVTVTYEHDGVHIQSVTEGGPAQKAGLLAGEIITAVDGQDVTGENSALAASLIQGEEGTQVVLLLLDEQGNTREVVVTRARLETDPVSYELLEGNIGCIRIENFYSGTADQAIAAVEELSAQGAVGLIFDVRSNPGGYMNQMAELLDYLLPEGPIYCSGTLLGPKKVVTSDEACVELPMTVLINGDTYSAAELFAAQLRESVGASIVGQPSTGKGYSQQTFRLPGGRALNLSTKTYYTGSGISLIGTGVTPDVVVELTDSEDAQLATAVAGFSTAKK